MTSADTSAPALPRVAIVGAGPAGLACAIALAQRGILADVFDPAFPRQSKPCGEGLLPTGVASLRELGVHVPDEDKVVLHGICYCEGTTSAVGAFPAPAWGVARSALMAALSRRADSLGLVVRRDKVLDVAGDEHHVQLQWQATGADRARERYDFAVVADGLHGNVRPVPVAARASGGPKRFGVRQHFAMAPWSRCIEVHLADGMEAYVTPVSATSINVAILADTHRQKLPRTLLPVPPAFSTLARRLTGAVPLDASRGAGPFWQHVPHVVHGRVARLGDAAGYADAATGEGVGMALQMATELACVIATHGELRTYERIHRRRTRSQRAHARAILAATRFGVVRRVGLRLLSRFGWLLDAWVRLAVGRPRQQKAAL